MGGRRSTQVGGDLTKPGAAAAAAAATAGAAGAAAGGGCGPRGPRVTAESYDGRPHLDGEAAVPAGEDGAVDAEALNAALLAVQADASVSRVGLHRMLSARQRRPLREDSSPVFREGNNGLDGSGSARDDWRGASPRPEHRHRTCMPMDDLWVSVGGDVVERGRE